MTLLLLVLRKQKKKTRFPDSTEHMMCRVKDKKKEVSLSVWKRGKKQVDKLTHLTVIWIRE